MPATASPSIDPVAGLAFAVRYPASLIDLRTLPDGERLLLRPVLPQDDLLLAELMSSLSSQARRHRFHALVYPTVTQLQPLCRVDYVRNQALVISTERDGVEQLVADARYSVAEDGESAEFALLVHERWSSRGLGQWAMRALEQAAAQAGVNWMCGEVLTENAPMLRLMQRCGYAVTPHTDDEGLMQVQRRLCREIDRRHWQTPGSLNGPDTGARANNRGLATWLRQHLGSLAASPSTARSQA